jgi:hypothetical protein
MTNPNPLNPMDPRVKDILEIELWFNVGDTVRIRPDCSRKILLHNDWAVGMDLDVIGFTVVGNDEQEIVNYMVQCSDRRHPAHADRKAYINENHLYEVHSDA